VTSRLGTGKQLTFFTTCVCNALLPDYLIKLATITFISLVMVTKLVYLRWHEKSRHELYTAEINFATSSPLRSHPINQLFSPVCSFIFTYCDATAFKSIRAYTCVCNSKSVRSHGSKRETGLLFCALLST
jgi:hypothetical protein